MLHVLFYCSVHDTSFKQIEARSFECVIYFSLLLLKLMERILRKAPIRTTPLVPHSVLEVGTGRRRRSCLACHAILPCLHETYTRY